MAGNKSHVVGVMAQNPYGGIRLLLTEPRASDIEMLKNELRVTKQILLNTRQALYQAADELERLLRATKVADHRAYPALEDDSFTL